MLQVIKVLAKLVDLSLLHINIILEIWLLYYQAMQKKFQKNFGK